MSDFIYGIYYGASMMAADYYGLQQRRMERQFAYVRIT